MHFKCISAFGAEMVYGWSQAETNHKMNGGTLASTHGQHRDPKKQQGRWCWCEGAHLCWRKQQGSTRLVKIQQLGKGEVLGVLGSEEGFTLLTHIWQCCSCAAVINVRLCR